VNKARKQREAVHVLSELSANIAYENSPLNGYPGGSPPEWNLLERLCGADFFYRVVKVELNDIPMTDAEFAHVGNLEDLQDLFIQGTGITDEGLKHLRGLRKLEVLYLLDTDVTDDGLVHLKGLRQLKELHLSGSQITDEGRAKLKAALPAVSIQ